MQESLNSNDFKEYAAKKAKHITSAKNIAPLLERIASLPAIPSHFYSDNGIHCRSR